MIINVSTRTDQKFSIGLVDPVFRKTIGEFRLNMSLDNSVYMTKAELETLMYEAQAALYELETEAENRADDAVLSDADSLS